tara:strand:- start:342 stop:602 length:261 start_codon:yes stop_codon:yes gene_type:complete
VTTFGDPLETETVTCPAPVIFTFPLLDILEGLSPSVIVQKSYESEEDEEAVVCIEPSLNTTPVAPTETPVTDTTFTSSAITAFSAG